MSQNPGATGVQVLGAGFVRLTTHAPKVPRMVERDRILRHLARSNSLHIAPMNNSLAARKYELRV